MVETDAGISVSTVGAETTGDGAPTTGVGIAETSDKTGTLSGDVCAAGTDETSPRAGDKDARWSAKVTSGRPESAGAAETEADAGSVAIGMVAAGESNHWDGEENPEPVETSARTAGASVAIKLSSPCSTGAATGTAACGATKTGRFDSTNAGETASSGVAFWRRESWSRGAGVIVVSVVGVEGALVVALPSGTGAATGAEKSAVTVGRADRATDLAGTRYLAEGERGAGKPIGAAGSADGDPGWG